MKRNPLIIAGSPTGRHRETWRRTVARGSKIIGKSCNELKALAYNRMRWKTGVIDALWPPWDRGQKEKEEENCKLFSDYNTKTKTNNAAKYYLNCNKSTFTLRLPQQLHLFSITMPSLIVE